MKLKEIPGGTGVIRTPGKTPGLTMRKDMGKVIGYMLTWTTYGTWLQGDERGYVKDGDVLEGNKELHDANKNNLKRKTVRLTQRQKILVKKGIIAEAEKIGQKVMGITVFSNHVHVVLNNTAVPLSKIAARYKTAGRMELKKAGFKGKVWTTGYDKRYCFSDEELKQRIEYVRRHDK